MSIADHLNLGIQNKVTRDDLCLSTERNDRENRRAIEEYNEKHGADPSYPYICSSSNYSGYWLSYDIDEIKRYPGREHIRRMQAHLKPIRAIREREARIRGRAAKNAGA